MDYIFGGSNITHSDIERARFQDRRVRQLQRMQSRNTMGTPNLQIQVQTQQSSADLNKPTSSQMENLAIPTNPEEEPLPSFSAEEERIRATLPPHWVMKKTNDGRCYYECMSGKARIVQWEPPSITASFLTSNTVQSVFGIVRMLFDFYRFVMACLLGIFVPQDCTENSPEYPHTCSLSENMASDMTTFNKWVIYINFISLGIVFIHYLVVYKREMWMIEYLDVSEDEPMTNLPSVVPQFPEIGADLENYNLFLFITATTSVVINVLNAIMSGYLVFHDYYDGFRTATVYVTQLMLLITVLKGALRSAWVSMRRNLAISCVQTEFASFNVIDQTYLRKHAKDRQAIEMKTVASSSATTDTAVSNANANLATQTVIQTEPAMNP
eukprot:TRINITY_DN7509_c0_g1_i1.p1 TRINITY_DN7509_c0_g1~~TRINITY_DN7509_c0_g1_i1.p1  ORF type:complete len:383 (-),score=69.51 TRINITY_DN7509_c0_g1_i1:385-1533(-)